MASVGSVLDKLRRLGSVALTDDLVAAVGKGGSPAAVAELARQWQRERTHVTLQIQGALSEGGVPLEFMRYQSHDEREVGVPPGWAVAGHPLGGSRRDGARRAAANLRRLVPATLALRPPRLQLIAALINALEDLHAGGPDERNLVKAACMGMKDFASLLKVRAVPWRGQLAKQPGDARARPARLTRWHVHAPRMPPPLLRRRRRRPGTLLRG